MSEGNGVDAIALEPLPFDDSDEIAELKAALAARDERIAELEQRAYTDTLTSLPRRAVLQAWVENEIRRRRRFALIVIDLDGFKEVNDTRGHAAGDRLLRQVADALHDNIRDGDLAIRLGGDEFAVAIRDAFAANQTAERLRTAAEWELRVYGAGMSLGVAIYPECATSLADLMRIADERMYFEKSKRR
jgi:diguanylate cyclase (GGDEF)-like protein